MAQSLSHAHAMTSNRSIIFKGFPTLSKLKKSLGNKRHILSLNNFATNSSWHGIAFQKSYWILNTKCSMCCLEKEHFYWLRAWKTSWLIWLGFEYWSASLKISQSAAIFTEWSPIFSFTKKLLNALERQEMAFGWFENISWWFMRPCRFIYGS